MNRMYNASQVTFLKSELKFLFIFYDQTKLDSAHKHNSAIESYEINLIRKLNIITACAKNFINQKGRKETEHQQGNKTF